jgi:hypothetical protein
MCIFASPVRSVTGTRILVAPVNGGRQQLTVYENRVILDKGSGSNAMILPFPTGGCHLLDLSQYPGDVFDDCDAMMKPPMRVDGFAFGGGGLGFGASVAMKTLPVQRVGGYRCSVAHSLADLQRINDRVFTVSDEAKAVLTRHYATGFGFVVCVFDTSLERPHPIGYVTAMGPSNQLFIPTRHEHGSVAEPFRMGNVAGFYADDTLHDAHCDSCGCHPIRGIRYKCLHCADYDLCSYCDRARHDASHVFAELRRPTAPQPWQGMLLTAPVYTAATAAATESSVATMAEYDHVIYLYNGFPSMSTKLYTQLDVAQNAGTDRIKWRALLGLQLGRMRLMPLTTLFRIGIKGSFPNGDYTAGALTE